MSSTNKVHLLGAFDRFNYGDLLFPIIVRNELNHWSKTTEFAIFALIESDLSQYGAMPTRPLRSLYKKENLKSGDTVIFAGGGTVGVNWSYMYSNLLGHTGNAFLYYCSRVFGPEIVDKASRFRFGGKSVFPWLASPEEFPVTLKIAYNAIGGSEFENLPLPVQQQKLKILRQATYLSVRDARTRDLFSPVEDQISVELAPDSAVLMSEQYPISSLRTLATREMLQQIDGKSYLCFQCNLDYKRTHENEIIRSLEEIYEAYGLQAILLPIGRYAGLDDHIALRELRQKIRTPCETISDQASIFEIMLTVALSKVFVGTSLHGNVTAQSFAVPHLGLSDRPCKVDYYLNTWDLPEQSQCAPIENLVKMVGDVLAVDDVKHQEKRSELISLSHANFRKMFEKCDIA